MHPPHPPSFPAPPGARSSDAIRIAFDPQIFALQRHGGISRYFCGLAGALADLEGVTARVFAPLHINDPLARLPPALRWGRRLARWPAGRWPLYATSQALARWPLARFRPDIVHETYYSPIAYAPGRARRVVTVADMIHELFPESLSRRSRTSQWKRAAVRRADHVICISENTRGDLSRLFGVPREKTTVVHPGFAPLPPPAAAPPPARPYLLHVGQRPGYKNFAALLRAYAGSPRLRRELSVLCFGGGPLSARERALARELGCRDDILEDEGDDARLSARYRGAAMLAYPSLYEGFGIPPLEAMAAGCPVVCSNASSLPEVVGDAAEACDTREIEALRAAMERVAFDPGRRAELVARGKARTPRFAWSRCATETLAVYRRVCS